MIQHDVVHRSVRIPRLLRMVDSVSAAADALGELTQSGTGLFLVVHSGQRSRTGYAERLGDAARARGHRIVECVISANTASSVGTVGERIATTHPDFVVGVGGGRVVDVAKLAAAEAGAEFISVPTQASSDGICSPVAVIVADDGKPASLGARIPAGIVVDMAMLEQAPVETWRSGLGDLVSNLSAVRDWRLAHERHGEVIDDFACLTSEAAALSIVDETADLGSDEFRRKLIRGLILSGIAMEMAGSSRPASGSEHLVSHALDGLLEAPRLHGLQVALGTIAAWRLRGEDDKPLITFFRRVGLPVTPSDLGIEMDTFLRAVRLGPGTRPDRWTILQELSDSHVERLRNSYAGDEAVPGAG